LVKEIHEGPFMSEMSFLADIHGDVEEMQQRRKVLREGEDPQGRAQHRSRGGLLYFSIDLAASCFADDLEQPKLRDDRNVAGKTRVAGKPSAVSHLLVSFVRTKPQKTLVVLGIYG
jgi:hypothetical protein